MTLALAHCLDDAEALWDELEIHWRRGSLVGLAPPQERALLTAAVLGAAAGAGTTPGGAGSSDAKPQADPCRITPETGPDTSWGQAVVLGSGGSSGGRRWCLQPLSHLQASAEACGSWLAELGLDPGRCLLLDPLPLHHVSGLMPLIRARQWRAELRWLPSDLLRHPARLPQACPLPSNRPVLLSLVPTQLHRLLDSPEGRGWLRQCQLIWVGGAGLSPGLAARARSAGLPLAPCYGATETAAMVCALTPQRFLAGEPGCGTPLSDVELRLEGHEAAIAIRSARISPGWFEAGRLRPFRDADGWWRSGDAGSWIRLSNTASSTPGTQAPPAGASADPSLAIHGRLDGALLSGGETVFPEQLEQRLREQAAKAALPLEAVLLLGVPEEPWGERLAALVRPREDADGEALLEHLRRLTAGWPAAQRPRRWCLCDDLAPSEEGKWQRNRWRQWLAQTAQEDGGTGRAG